MLIKQLSVFLENKQGRLYAAIDVLGKNNIDISALSLADTSEFGILRLLVDRPEVAQKALTEAGIVVKITNVVAVAMDDVPGGTTGILNLLAGNGTNIEYMYACVGKVTGKALMVIRTDDVERTEKLLHDSGYGSLDPNDIYRIN